MQRPLQLSWHGVDPSDALEAVVREEVARLERFSRRITGCAVTIEAVSKHHRHGGSKYRVRIELSVPRGKLVVGRDPPRTVTHSDPYLVVKEAFREAARQLEDHQRIRQGRPKVRASPARGEVVRVFPADGYGFLRTQDGREIYFNGRSVLRSAFPRLRVGSVVRFAEESGDEGPQASTVELLPERGSRAVAVAARRRRRHTEER